MGIRDRNLYLSWITMTEKERDKLYSEAFTDAGARSLFNKISTSIRIETNKRLRELERKGFGYGKTYNNIMRYLEIEQGKRRVPYLKEVDYDIDELMTINEQARKFLKSKYSKAEHREKVADRQIEFFESNKERFGDIFNGLSKKKKRDFLRWLSNEEVSFAMDEYGTSDETVTILADAYQKQSSKTNGIETLNKALMEFNSGEISFDEAMRQVGVNIEEQFPELKRRWHFDKKNRSTFTR